MDQASVLSDVMWSHMSKMTTLLYNWAALLLRTLSSNLEFYVEKTEYFCCILFWSFTTDNIFSTHHFFFFFLLILDDQTCKQSICLLNCRVYTTLSGKRTLWNVWYFITAIFLSKESVKKNYKKVFNSSSFGKLGHLGDLN